TGIAERELRARRRLSLWLTTSVSALGITLAVALIDTLGQTFYVTVRALGFLGIGKLLLAGLGMTTVGATLSQTALFLSQISKTRRVSLPTNVLVAGGSFLVLLTSLVALSGGAHAIAWRGREPLSDPAQQMSPELIGLAFITGLLLSYTFSKAMAFLNLSSLQQVYAARLIRAYLGASNPNRQNGNGQIVRFVSEVVEGDQIRMEDYTPYLKGGPLHIVNVTFNETVDAKSQVEQHDRKGMGMALGPCGLSVGISHHGRWAGKNGNDSSTTSRDYSKLIPIRSDGQFHLFVGMRRINLLARSVAGARNAVAGAANVLADWVQRVRFLAKPARKFAQFIAVRKETEIVEVESLPLGNWMAISGAAFTTGLGAKTNLGLSLALGLTNVRLGYWWNSGIEPGDREGRQRPKWLGSELSRTFPVQLYLLDEILARFHGPARRLWYLSDGGHFENTAAYELIRRRIPYIIICDNGCDPTYDFEDLANLVRKARIDFGAEIEFARRRPTSGTENPNSTENRMDQSSDSLPYLEELVSTELLDVIGEPADFKLTSPCGGNDNSEDNGQSSRPHTCRHALLARVTYPKDEDQKAPAYSWLLVLKPSITGDEPLDIIQYQDAHPSFPQESTIDQFFDEAQWESYRKLGEHIGNLIFYEPAPQWPQFGRSTKCPV
ncbi:MAG: hypothetical protein KGS61_15210, partial [Verrucomicrobia bacterium]|nr:hypothetical protein [Verrucomicrobiota bacterium]